MQFRVIPNQQNSGMKHIISRAEQCLTKQLCLKTNYEAVDSENIGNTFKLKYNKKFE